ncbi:response regulator [Methanoregula sp.]|uniref:response regulator n=1 Tax=Methanoregula sp. TaxID=2052170 RepID=UPI00356846BE
MNETILVVDDSTFIEEGLVAILKRNGYTTLSVKSGDECLDILKTTTPDIIILDILMEPMDGWETLSHLKANPATAGIPVLMFSAKKISPSEALEHRKDIDGFVTKPVNFVQLINSIQRILDRRNDMKVEGLATPDTDPDKALIDEYTALPSSIELDKDLLFTLKKSTGGNAHLHRVPAEDLAAVKKLEEKIRTDERHLKELNETRTVPPKASVDVSHLSDPTIMDPVPTTKPVPVANPGPVPPVTPTIPVVIPSISIPDTSVPDVPMIQPSVDMSLEDDPAIMDPVPAKKPVPVADPVPVPPVTPVIPVVIPSVSIPDTSVPDVPMIQPSVDMSLEDDPAIMDPVPTTEPTLVIKKGIPVLSSTTSPAPARTAGTPVPESRPGSTKPKTLIIAGIIIVILVVAVAVFVLFKPL